MSIESTVARVEAIKQAMVDPAELIGSRSPLTGGVEAPREVGATGTGTFATALERASGAYGAQALEGASSGEGAGAGASAPVSYDGVAGAISGVASSPTGVQGGLGGASPGARIVAAAEGQLGETEQPPGSNESPAIAMYRSATAGAVPGAPWCAYFASWAARQAGEPIGSDGQGLGSVSEIWSWAQSTGRAIPNGPGVVPQPGDLIVFGSEHVGIVRGVLPNGQIETIEGNYENKVAANVRSPTEATGYVNMN